MKKVEKVESQPAPRPMFYFTILKKVTWFNMRFFSSSVLHLSNSLVVYE